MNFCSDCFFVTAEFFYHDARCFYNAAAVKTKFFAPENFIASETRRLNLRKTRTELNLICVFAE